MIPERERKYEEYLRVSIDVDGRIEKRARAMRQKDESKLRTLLNKRGVERLLNGCPPAFALDCGLEDGTMCPFYHEGQCVKAKKEEAGA